METNYHKKYENKNIEEGEIYLEKNKGNKIGKFNK
jgi:hypothetical protein